MDRLSTRTHGILDLITAGTLVTLPRAMGWSDRVTGLLTTLGAGALGYSMITDYEFGMVRILPMRAHLAMDALSGVSLCAAAAMFTDEDDSTRSALLGLGLFEIGAALMTRPEADDRTGWTRVREGLEQAAHASGTSEGVRQSSTSAAL